MFQMTYDDDLINQLATKIADRAMEKITDKLSSVNNLPHLLTRKETMEVLRCGPTKMSELMSRDDFPVIDEFGKKVPTSLLFKWIENNTRWVDDNTDFFQTNIA